MKPSIHLGMILVIACSAAVLHSAASARAGQYPPSYYAASPAATPELDAVAPQNGSAGEWGPEISCCTCYCWDVWANVLVLNRNTRGDIPLAFGDPGDPKGSEVFGSGDLNFGAGWGPQIGAYRCLDCCNSVGVEFFAIDSWSANETVAGNISVLFPSLVYLPEQGTPGAPSTGYGVATYDYHSRLYNTEVNLRHRCGADGWLTALVGFRAIELSEQFGAVFTTGQVSPSFSIDTNNHLYGLQIGALANLYNNGPWFIDGAVKAGVYGNSARQTTREDYTSVPGGQTTLVSAHGTNCAFVGDLSVALGRQITDRLAARIGYTALWIEGVALAPDQLDNVDPSANLATLDHNGGVFLHGAFAGLEYLW